MPESSQFAQSSGKQEASQKLVEQALIGKKNLQAVNGLVAGNFFDKKMASPDNQHNGISQNAARVPVQGFVDLSVCDENGKPVHDVSLKFDLFQDAMPKTCDNFLKLCEGTVDCYGQKMHYKNSVIYEIVPGWVVVGGDFVNNNGTGGKAVYKEGVFEDEGFTAVDYAEPGLLCMLSYGPNTNSSIFFITLKPAPWLKGLYVAFGKVTEGMEALRRLSEEVGAESGVPNKIVKISACGAI